MTDARRRIAGVIGLALLALLAAALLLAINRPATGAVDTHAPTGTAAQEPIEPTADERFFARGLFGFDLPPAWRFYPMSYSATGINAFGFVASQQFDVGSVCATDGDGSTCTFGSYAIDPGNVAILLAGRANPPFSDSDVPLDAYLHPKAGEPVVVGGVPAVLTRGRGPDGRLTLSWRIMRPDAPNNWIEIDAEVVGPDEEALAAQVVAAIGTFRYSTSIQPQG